MRVSTLFGQLLAALALVGTVAAGPVAERGMKKIKPKVFIIDMVRTNHGAVLVPRVQSDSFLVSA
jgi:ABC-type transporter Mla maintaining outer membrane lipid asymmetry permease subunit MlaE